MSENHLGEPRSDRAAGSRQQNTTFGEGIDHKKPAAGHREEKQQTFTRRLFRCRSGVPRLKRRLREDSLRRMALLTNSATNYSTSAGVCRLGADNRFSIVIGLLRHKSVSANRKETPRRPLSKLRVAAYRDDQSSPATTRAITACSAMVGGVNRAARCRTWRFIIRNLAAIRAMIPNRISSRPVASVTPGLMGHEKRRRNRSAPHGTVRLV